jgi:hypothetical protein
LCDSTFTAIERANQKAARGFTVTGVVACIDSRHGFILPNAVADLQKGERWDHFYRRLSIAKSLTDMSTLILYF